VSLEVVGFSARGLQAHDGGAAQERDAAGPSTTGLRPAVPLPMMLCITGRISIFTILPVGAADGEVARAAGA
jgi:hypothetical protein